MIAIPIGLILWLVIWLVLKQLEKTTTGNIIIGVFVLALGIFLLVVQQLGGIIFIVISTIYLLIYIVPAVKRSKLNLES
ncbi:MAG: hypothetical protein ACXABG_09020 [Promethearchaeota archaeon]|jgi:hypothetical protein